MSSMFKFIMLGFSLISTLSFSAVADNTQYEVGHFNIVFVLDDSVELLSYFCFLLLMLISCFMLILSLHQFLYDSVGFVNHNYAF